jgi:putative sigma-54 modulation protein
MQINITGHHVEITDAIRDAVNARLKKLHQHFPDMTSLTVVLTVEKHEQTAEVTTHFLGQDFNAKAKADDMYQSIAEMATKLSSLLQRQKEKVKSHAHPRPQQIEPVEEVIDEE